MASIRQYRSARRALEQAAASLIERSIHFTGATEAWRTRELLEAAREYGRAFARVEMMRVKP